MNFTHRIRRILLEPKTEWRVIADERASPVALYGRYAAPLAAIGPMASFLGLSVIGIGLPFIGQVRVSMGAALASALAAFVLSLLGIFLMALFINLLAPRFHGQRSELQALKLAVYAFTPAWLAGVLHVLPALSVLALVVSLYGLYLLYLGLPLLMRVPSDRSGAYAAVVVLAALAVHGLVGLVMGSVISLAGSAGWGVTSRQTPRAVGEELAQLDEIMASVSRKLEQPQPSGRILASSTSMPSEPVDHVRLKALLPAELHGMVREHLVSSQNGLAVAQVAMAEGRYVGDGGRVIELSITDTGGGPSLAMLAAWAVIEQNHETEQGYEKTVRWGERVVHEVYNRHARQGRYQMLIGGRFVVAASGDGVEMEVMRQAVAKIGLNPLEAMGHQAARKAG